VVFDSAIHDGATPKDSVPGVWSAYDGWNAAVAEVFFGGDSRGRPVYLDLEDEPLSRIASSVGSTLRTARDDLRAAVLPTLRLDGNWGERVFSEHARRAVAWEAAETGDPPPCCGLLAFFSMVAEEMRGDDKFRATNYYGRLCTALEVEPHGPLADRLQRDFREHSLLLWGTLNRWLTASHGERGLPTAWSFDYRVYVGVPISQALLRDHDRRDLPSMFRQYRLTPGQQLSRPDMVRLLNDWLLRGGGSVNLRHLWRSVDAQSRVADVACLELENWDGQDEPAALNEATGQLLVVAELRRHPRPRLNMALMVRRSGRITTGSYRLEAGLTDTARAAFEDLGEEFRLERFHGTDWLAIPESHRISMPDAIAAQLVLNAVDGSTTLERPPRSLIALELSDELLTYAEVPRIQLGQQCMLLVRDALAASVDELLSTTAREGYRRQLPTDLPGLAEGWVAFCDVELMDVPETDLADLSPLVPLAWTNIGLAGGVRLMGHATFLRGELPEVSVSSLEGKEMSVFLQEDEGSSGSAQRLALARFSGAAVIRLTDHGLREGDYRIVLAEGSGARPIPVASAALHIRSADTPRVLRGDQRYALGMPVEDGFARPVELVNGNWPLVLGARVPDQVVAEAKSYPRPPESLSTPSPFLMESEAAPTAGATEMKSGEIAPCMIGAAHYWLLPPAGPERPSVLSVEGHCKRCGLERSFPTRPRQGRRTRKVRGKRTAASMSPSTRVDLKEVPPIEDRSRGGLATLLEIVLYGQTGSWAEFKRAADQVDDTPWFASEAARSLSALGHVEFEAAKAGRWAVCPPTLAGFEENNSAGAILCGQRTTAMIARLEADLVAIGGELEVQEAGSGASVVVARAPTEDLEDVAESVSAATDTPLRFVDSAAKRLAQLSPPMSVVASWLPLAPAPVGSKLERFDFVANRWVQSDHAFDPGAYRIQDWPAIYAVSTSRDGPEKVRIGNSRIVKWLAAHEQGISLLAYDPVGEVLTCRLGAQLPGIHERAAVLASGHLPVSRTDGTVSYESVPESLAQRLWSTLGPAE
jgi:hypothetical protein